MSYDNSTEGAGIWEQRRSRFEGTALEGGELLNPAIYMHLLAGCAFDPGEIVGTPNFIKGLMQGRFRGDLEAHLSRIDMKYYPCQNRDCLETKNGDDDYMVTIDGELTLCMLLEEMKPVTSRLASDGFCEICRLPPEERSPELNEWLEQVCDQAETYDDDHYWDEDCDD